MSQPIVPTQITVEQNGISLAVYQWGKANTKHKTIVFIHGYPDSADVWIPIAETLANDFHIVTYDVRGTGASTVPSKTKGYHLDELVADISAVIRATSPNQPVHLVGHDWGALQGWEAVLDDRLKPQIVSYTALAPSLDKVGLWFHSLLQENTSQSYLRLSKQLLSSSYMAAFQIPVVPEMTWRLGLSWAWPKMVSVLERAPVPASKTQLKNSINGIGLYRINLVPKLLNPKQRYTSIPVHLIEMTEDPFVPRHFSDGLEAWTSKLTRSEVKAGHWGISSQPKLVANCIKQYLV
ncbi:hypothetical protein F901_03038 [Acinetobacter dispersus]|uniref:alpha/beta fold hydrolase n=1 Tax=Acinetobacter dispersus TaxID=70348 RepID=UPI0002CE638E|nr:alpha/beta fold hydrolase [Acinetobacter dispersus]ENX51850.1 hypothetical protein F901_03038 [Acinetobacter dispersus]